MKKYIETTIKIWKILKPFQKYFYLQLAFIVFVQLNDVLNIFLISKVIDFLSAANFQYAYYATALAAFIYAMRLVVSYFQNANELKKLDIHLFQFLEEYSAKRVLALNPFQYIEEHSAVKFQVIQNGERAVKAIVSVIILNVVPVVTMLIFSIGAIFFLSKTIAIWVLFSSLFVLLWSAYFTRYIRPLLQKNIDNWVENGRQRSEMFTHLSLIRTSGVEEKYIESRIDERKYFGDFSIEVALQRLKHGQKRFTFFSSSRFATLFYLIYLASKSSISVGSVYSIYTWLVRSYENIFSLVQLMRQIPVNYIEAEKYFKIIDKEPEFMEGGNIMFSKGDIIFDKVVFKYPKGESPVLKGLSFTIPYGKKVAFVGPSGSGKTSIIKLLLRIYDFQEGSIFIDNKNIKDINSQSLRKKIGYVEQHVDLFDASVKDNILLGAQKRKVTEEEIKEVVQKSRINEFKDRLGEKGLNTLIGERGVKLSGGERQRIGIARALLRNPDILIFDEATASLDSVNERFIQEAIDETSLGRTSIIIAHRLSTVVNSDIIFVLKNGKLDSSGTHNELLEKSEVYQELVKYQFTS
jgi:ATP-binding cassette subfamily B protein AbcA/BmrA